MNMQKLFGTVVALVAGFTSLSQASVIYGGSFSGTDCSGAGGFANCYATTAGTQQGASAGASPSIYKRDADGKQDVGSFASITGSEFVITLNGTTNVLSFSYTPGINDPAIHYFTIKQANGFALFYDLTAPITSYSTSLDAYFPRNPGFSHITFFDTGATPPVGVPEPMTLGLLGAGLIGLGVARRRKPG